MKMTRNRMNQLYRTLAGATMLAVAAILPAAPVVAQETGAAGAKPVGGEPVSIELNKLEPQGEACRAYLVVKNTGEQAFDSLKLDLVMFDEGGVVAKRLAVQAAPLPAGKTSLKVFDIQGHACPDISSILLNDVLECTPALESPGGCLAQIAVSARGELSFLK